MSAHDLRRAIEPMKARARERALSHRRGPIPPDHDLLARLDSAVTAARTIEATLAALSDELPGLFPFRRLGQGGWVVGLSGNELVPRPGCRPRAAFTRFEVLVSLSAREEALELVCHRNVQDHDLDVLRRSHAVSEDPSALVEWIEAACLEFAEALLAVRSDETWRPHRAGLAHG
ncbi:MAG TPA: hypothetical protein VFD43_08090 [Planctomycetota bacterium]|nr:hypothetical protein [Planctomycetota bacterium]